MKVSSNISEKTTKKNRQKAGPYKILGETIAKVEFFDNALISHSRYMY